MSPTVLVGGLRLAYSSRGDGPPVLLIMGLGLGRWAWARQVPPLSRRFRVITYDHRGTGESEASPPGYGIEDLAADALGLLDALGIARTHVVGLSMGGQIAQVLAGGRPSRVERLVLCATSPGGPGAVHPDPALWGEFLDITRMPTDRGAEVSLRLVFGREFRDRDPRTAALVARAYRENLPSPETVAAQGLACERFDGAALAARITVPTLVVHGTADVLVHPDNARLLASLIPGATLLLYEGAGHGLIIEQARRFNRDVAAFLGSGGREATAGGRAGG